MSFIKALFIVVTKPLWCSVQGLWQLWRLKRYEKQQSIRNS